MQQEDVSFTITKSYLQSLGVDLEDSSQVQAAIYVCGGLPYDYTITPDVYVRCKDKPYMTRKETIYVARRRQGAYVGNLCGEGENLDVNSINPSNPTLMLCTNMDYSDNYVDNREAKLLMKKYLNKAKKKGPSNQQGKSKHTGFISAKG